MAEHRTKTRIGAQYQATLTFDKCAYAVITSNLSLAGALCAFVKPDVNIAEKAMGTLELQLADDVLIMAEVRIVRKAPDMAAVEFIDLDETSLIHLQNLVRLNAQDADVIDCEIAPDKCTLKDGSLAPQENNTEDDTEFTSF